MIVSMITAVIGQVFFKKGLVGTELTPSLKSIVSVIFTPTLLFGFFFYGLSAILWLFVLKRFPLSVAYPSLSLTYILILFISVAYFGESLSLLKFLGVFLIFGGVVLINL
jgi:multidrug transporter EmrE-like cation transporter